MLNEELATGSLAEAAKFVDRITARLKANGNFGRFIGDR
jgi:hypothetical protein